MHQILHSHFELVPFKPHSVHARKIVAPKVNGIDCRAPCPSCPLAPPRGSFVAPPTATAASFRTSQLDPRSGDRNTSSPCIEAFAYAYVLQLGLDHAWQLIILVLFLLCRARSRFRLKQDICKIQGCKDALFIDHSVC